MSATTTDQAGHPELVLGSELEDFRASVRGFLEQRSSEAEVRRAIELPHGYDPQLWEQLNAELGLAGLIVPERYGGAAFGPVEMAPLFEELGRALTPSPAFATVALATNLLLQSEDEEACAEHLPEIAAGRRTATVCWPDAAVGEQVPAPAVTAEPAGDGWTLRGAQPFVLDGEHAELLLVLAAEPAGVSVFAVGGAAAGVTRTPQEGLDPTRRLARLAFDATPAVRVGRPGAGAELLSRTLDLAIAALAAEQVGGAARILEEAVSYAQDRVQFGRAIGSFQAIKHKLADQYGHVESARVLAYNAAWVAGHVPERLPEAASMAKSRCSVAYSRVAAESLQVHGGIGFTWEHKAHLYYKRARASEALLGTPREHRRRLRSLLSSAAALSA